MKKNLQVGLVLFATLLFSACSMLPTKTDTDIVESRSALRLEALKKLDFEKAYTYMSPGYRSIKGLDRFKLENAGAVNLLDFQVQPAECVEDTCQVLVNSNYKITIVSPGFSVKKPLNIERASKETWIRTDGQWWFVKSE
jgi:hypothetical protein